MGKKWWQEGKKQHAEDSKFGIQYSNCEIWKQPLKLPSSFGVHPQGGVTPKSSDRHQKQQRSSTGWGTPGHCQGPMWSAASRALFSPRSSLSSLFPAERISSEPHISSSYDPGDERAGALWG